MYYFGISISGLVLDKPTASKSCGLNVLLVLSLAARGFSPGTPVFPSFKNQHFQIPIRCGTHGHVSTSSFTKRTPKCSMGKETITTTIRKNTRGRVKILVRNHRVW